MTNKVEDHVVSLEMAKKLEEAGWDKPTIFAHGEDPKFEDISSEDLDIEEAMYYNYYDVYPAPLATELLETIRDKWVDHITISLMGDYGAFSRYTISKPGYSVAVRHPDCDERIFLEDTLANSIASLWIYLKQQNLL